MTFNKDSYFSDEDNTGKPNCEFPISAFNDAEPEILVKYLMT